MSNSTRLFALALVAVAMLLAGCGATQPGCQAQVRSYTQLVNPITAEWGTAVQRANNAPRADLPPALDAMRAIRRQADGVAVPECAKNAHGLLTQSMDMQLQGFRDTLDNKPSATVQQEFSNASQLFANFDAEIRRLAGANL